MFKMRCQVCGSTHTIKYGVRKGVQLYRCGDCGYQFRAIKEVSKDELWRAYQQGKQTIKELSVRFGISVSTVKRRLRNIKREWVNPPLEGRGFLHLDMTYWGRGFGVLLALDSAAGFPLYIAFVKSETLRDYENAVENVRERGYNIDGIIIDGKQALFKTFSGYHIQMCQFHMKQIIKRYLTKNPKLLAARALKALVDKLTRSEETEFKTEFAAWKEEWHETIDRRPVYKDGSTHYTSQCTDHII